jgi:hypothetical protein
LGKKVIWLMLIGQPVPARFYFEVVIKVVGKDRKVSGGEIRQLGADGGEDVGGGSAG